MERMISFICRTHIRRERTKIKVYEDLLVHEKQFKILSENTSISRICSFYHHITLHAAFTVLVSSFSIWIIYLGRDFSLLDILFNNFRHDWQRTNWSFMILPKKLSALFSTLPENNLNSALHDKISNNLDCFFQ